MGEITLTNLPVPSYQTSLQIAAFPPTHSRNIFVQHCKMFWGKSHTQTASHVCAHMFVTTTLTPQPPTRRWEYRIHTPSQKETYRFFVITYTFVTLAASVHSTWTSDTVKRMFHTFTAHDCTPDVASTRHSVLNTLVCCTVSRILRRPSRPAMQLSNSL
jgi:hypothetical protein